MRVLETVLCLDPESCTAAETLSRSTVSIHCQSLMHVSQVILDVTVDLTDWPYRHIHLSSEWAMDE